MADFSKLTSVEHARAAGLRVTEEILRGFLEKSGVNAALKRLGYVLVPKEPTREMIVAAMAKITVAPNAVQTIWRAMIEASQVGGREIEQHGPHAKKHPDEASKQKG